MNLGAATGPAAHSSTAADAAGLQDPSGDTYTTYLHSYSFIGMTTTTPPRIYTIDIFNKRTLGIYCFDIYLTVIFFKLADTIPLGQYCLEL